MAILLAGCAAAVPSISPSGGAASPTSGEESSAPASSLQPVARPTTRPAGFTWQRTASIPALGQLREVVASRMGYLLLEGRRTIWFSPDGRTWTKASLPFETSTSNGVGLDAWANEIAGSPDGFIAVGGYDRTPCTPVQGDGGPPSCARRPISWSSSDGVTWRSNLSTPIPSDGSALPAYSEFARVWPAGVGFDAAVEARDSVLYHGDVLLHSTDGRTWIRLTPGPLPDGTTSNDIYAHGGAATASGQRLLWQVQHWDTDAGALLATSSDGIAWTPVSGFDGTGASIWLSIGPEPGATTPWLLLGEVSRSESTSPAVWFSEDRTTWRTGTLQVSGSTRLRLSAVAHEAGGYVAVGLVYSDVGEDPVTWASANGTTWSQVPGSEPEPSDGPVLLAAGPAGLIGIGSAGDRGSSIWTGADPAQ